MQSVEEQAAPGRLRRERRARGDRLAPPGLVLFRSTGPSRWSRRVLISALAATAAAIALYLAAYQYGAIGSVWDPLFGTSAERVLDSAASRAIGRLTIIPDSALGAIAYTTELAFALIGSPRRWREHPWLVALFGANSAALALAGVLLVALQAFVIRAGCLLCLCSAAISLTIAALATEEVRAAVAVLRHGE